MLAAIVERTDSGFVLRVEVPYRASMLDAEEAILAALNDAGTLATAEALEHLDADGRPIVVGDTRLTSKGERLGMKWKDAGAAAVLAIRTLTYTTGRWSQFWAKVDRHGFPVAA